MLCVWLLIFLGFVFAGYGCVCFGEVELSEVVLQRW